MAINIFDAKGKLVSTPLKREMEKGWHSVSWDGRSNSGVYAPAGIYLVTLKTRDNIEKIKLSLLK